jgi:alcohol dehydrogenase YqhD (iron-dependent ADH family)
MLNFDFHAPTRILFGRDQEKDIGALLQPWAKKVLLHYGGGSVKKSGLYDRVAASLKENGIEVVALGGVSPNPRLSLIQQGIELCRRERIELILAVGGGSVIDSAKAIAIGVDYPGNVWEVYEQGKTAAKALPIAVILTIPAAGSEASNRSVVTNEEKQMKLGVSSALFRPRLSVINPELFFTLPRQQIANGVTDIMSHIFERYFTPTLKTDVTDGLCETVLRTVIKNAPLLIENPENYDAWCEIAFCGTIAHNDLLGLGREQDWACHRMEHELSALYDVAHAAGLAVLTPFWMQYVYKEQLPMFVQFAVNVMGVQGSYREPEELARAGMNRLREFYEKLGQPSTLAALGIDDSRLEWMAKKATGEAYGKESPLGGIRKLYWQDVLNIYTAAR